MAEAGGGGGAQTLNKTAWPATSLVPALGVALLAGFAAGYQVCRLVDTLRAAHKSEEDLGASETASQASSKSQRKSKKRKKQSGAEDGAAKTDLDQDEDGAASMAEKRPKRSDEGDELAEDKKGTNAKDFGQSFEKSANEDEGDSAEEEEEGEEDEDEAPASSRERRLQENGFVFLEDDESDSDEEEDAKESQKKLYSASKRLKAEEPKTHCALVETSLDVAGLVAKVASPFAGAIVTFSGTTRNSFQDKIVTHLEYSAYESMATKELHKVCAQTRERWPDVLHMAIEHKIGDSPVQDTSVVIAVSSAHRAAALEACHFAIDTLKARVPIWKKEAYLGRRNEAQWKANSEFLAQKPLP
ncbi:Molybdopterin synthase catalytic subunit [Hondaea fermentalgiana]|uniref:Molybdopterin synthase catalytic subunit n=1 Tax=Hondaea fermentalgiana TaxID=2315210 RepID=A0A2R5GC82_9STRA|nr:Molybdopterin synthase catalytic subunit [Hondaea fermentalgiana]|eukprot:GBG25771.1 Molybdopterin synthase catalytic subunit [Hondaea fermentalgiana]